MISSFARPVLKSLSFTTGRGLANSVKAEPRVRTKDRLGNKLNELDAILRSTGRVPSRNFLNGLKEMMQPETQVTPIQGLLMLRCCGSLLQEETKERRSELAEKTWSALIDREVRLDISHYNALLRIYLENSKHFDPLQFLEDIESKNIQPNRVTYQRIIHNFCATGQMETVAKLLLMLKKQNVPLTDTMFNSLLMGYIKAGDIDNYFSTLKTMIDLKLEPTDETYTTILSAAAEMASSDTRFIDLFNDTLKEMRNKKIQLSDQQILQVASQIPENQTELFDRTVALCSRDGEYNTDCYNAILQLVNSKKINLAMKLLKTMNRASSPLFQSGYFMIRQMVKANIDPNEVIRICDQLKQEGLTDYARSLAVESSFEFQDLETSRIYLKHFIEGNTGRPHFYWPLLTKCTSDSQVLDVLLKDMLTMDKSCSARSILDTFEEYVWTKNIRDPILFIDQLKPGNYPTSLIWTSLVNHHLQSNRLGDALQVLNKCVHLVHSRFIGPNLALAFVKGGSVNEFVSIVKKLQTMNVDGPDEGWLGRCLILYVSSGGNDRIPVTELLSGMKGIRIPEAVVDTLKERNLLHEQDIQTFNLADSYTYSKPGSHETADIDALENHLIELRSQGMNTRGTERRLIIAYCKKTIGKDSDSVVKRVQELMADLSNQGIMVSDATYASMMDMYANFGELEKALELKEKISPEFKIDAFKIINLAAALIKKERIDDALSLIQEQLQIDRPRRDEPAPASVERNVFKILNTAAEVTRDSELIKKLFEVVLPLVNVSKPTNVMMGPMIKVHLLNNNIKGALEEFAHAASTFNVTPWKGELMKKVIEMDDPVSLQLITDISVKLHGESSTLVDAAIAFLKVGKLIQAKKVMMHPSFFQSERAVYHAAERMVTTNEIETLEKYTETMAQVPCKIEKEPLYFQLIRAYAARNDPAKALDVWTTMQEQEIIPTPRTLKYLGSFLEESGVTVPFDYSNLGTQKSHQQEKSSKQTNEKVNGSLYPSNVISSDLDDVLEHRKKFLVNGKNPSVAADGTLIDRLINSDRRQEAVDILKNLIDRGLYPVPRVLRQVVGILNKNGDLQTMEGIRGKLPEQFTNQVWFTNQLAYCYINAGHDEKFVNEVLPTLHPVPLSAILTILQKRPEFEPTIMNLADRLLKDQNNALIHNIIWTHRMISHRFDEARKILEAIPQLKDSLLFQSLVHKIRLDKDIELADALASMMAETNLLGRKLAEVHSAKIDALVEMDKVEDAENHLIRILAEEKTKTSKLVLEDLKRMSLVRLRQKLIEVCGREPRFEIPQKSRNGDGEMKQRVADRV